MISDSMDRKTKNYNEIPICIIIFIMDTNPFGNENIPYKMYPCLESDEYFRGCQNLESIIIPSTVEYITSEAFNNSHNLTIYAEPTERPTGWPENFAGSGPVVFWYSETNPGAKEGNYWHYVDDIPTKW